MQLQARKQFRYPADRGPVRKIGERFEAPPMEAKALVITGLAEYVPLKRKYQRRDLVAEDAEKAGPHWGNK